MIRSISHVMIVFLFSLSLVACKKEDPNPELMDPIYKDLEARYSAYSKNIEESKARIVGLNDSLEKVEARSLDRKNLMRDLEKEKLKLMNSEQLARYYKIRAERRKLTGRIAYKKAFAEGKAWPDPAEYSQYEVNTRLQEANRNWATRVPKLHDRISSGGHEKPAKKPEAAEGGGGEH